MSESPVKVGSERGAAIGFVGLGNMGGPMVANLCRGRFKVIGFDAADTASRICEGAVAAESLEDLAASVQTVFLCLPNGQASRAVVEGLAGTGVTTVADHSTIGITAAREISAWAAGKGIEYVDAPVSGGVSGAVKGTISLMFAGSAPTLERLRAPFEAMTGNIFHVGTEPGQGQAMKVANNFLSATAMAATSEAVAFGEAAGLDMELMLKVLNVSSGQNTATAEKFPNRVLTGSYNAGFNSWQINKDLNLFREAREATGSAAPVSPAVIGLWSRLQETHGTVDLTQVYPFVRDENGGE